MKLITINGFKQPEYAFHITGQVIIFKRGQAIVNDKLGKYIKKQNFYNFIVTDIPEKVPLVEGKVEAEVKPVKPALKQRRQTKTEKKIENIRESAKVAKANETNKKK